MTSDGHDLIRLVHWLSLPLFRNVSNRCETMRLQLSPKYPSTVPFRQMNSCSREEGWFAILFGNISHRPVRWLSIHQLKESQRENEPKDSLGGLVPTVGVAQDVSCKWLTEIFDECWFLLFDHYQHSKALGKHREQISNIGHMQILSLRELSPVVLNQLKVLFSQVLTPFQHLK